MAIKVRLPNGRYIRVNTDDLEYAKARAIDYYKNENGKGFVDQTTRNLAIDFDKNNFDYETGVNAPWLRAKLGAAENLIEKETVLEEAVGGEGFTRNSKGDLALTPKGLEKLGIEPRSNQNVVIDSNRMFELGDFADFAGIVGPVVGSVAGSIFTRGKLKPQFPGLKHISLKQLGVISAGTGTGAALGKSAEEATEYVAGLQKNTPGELAELFAKEAAIGAGGEALFGLAGKAIKYTFGQKALSRQALGAEDLKQAAAITRGIVDSKTGKTYQGAVALSALDSPLSGLLQSITEEVSKYKGRRVGLRSTLITDTNNLVRSTNDLASSFDQTIEDTIKVGYGDSAADLAAGKNLAGRISSSFDNAEFKLDQANNNLKKVGDDILNDFDAFKDPATTQAGSDIRELTHDAYFAWDATQRQVYDSIGKFFEIPRNISQGLEKSAVAGKAGLGRQAEFIDPTTLKEYVDIMVQNSVDASGKIDPVKAGPQLQAYQDLLNRTGKNLSLKELIELRSDLASANRITDVGQPGFASLESAQRSDMLTIIDETLASLEKGDSFAYQSLESFFTKNVAKSREQLELINLQIEDLEKIIQGPSTPTLRNLIDDVSKTSDDAIVQANQAAYKDVFDSQNADIQSKIGKAQNDIAFAEINLAKAVKNKSYNQKILNDGIDPRDRSFGSGARELTPEQRAGYEADLAKAENLRVESNNTIIQSKEILDQIEADPQFVSYKQVAQQELKLFERDAAYHQKVIDDITNKAFKNNKIDSKKIKAQIRSIKIANKFYSSGMQSFEQATLKSIMDDALAGGHNTDKILTNVILKNNNGEEVRRFLDSLDVDTSSFQKQRYKKTVDGKEVPTGRVDRSKGPVRESLEFTAQERKILKDADIKVNELTFQNADEVKGILQREFIRHIVKTTQKNGNVTNYRQIANAIEGYGTTGDVLFGSTKKSELLKSLRQADDLVNTQDASELRRILNNTSNVDHVIDDLNAKIAAQDQLTEISKLEIYNKIKNGSIDSENIVNTLFKRGNSEDIVKIKELLGPESVEFKEFQVAAMRKILNDYLKPGDDVIEKLFDDSKFYDAIMSPNGYGESVLKETFGDEQYRLLKEAAKRAKFAVGGERAAGGGGLFTQGFMFKVLSAPTQLMGKFSMLRFLAVALGSKRFLRWLTGDVGNQQIIKEMPEILEKMGYYRGLNFEDSITGFRAGQPIRRSIGIQIPAENIKETNEYIERQYENRLVDPKAPIAVTPLELPEVESTASLSPQGQAPISRSLLGNSPANLEIAERRFNEIDQGLQGLA